MARWAYFASAANAVRHATCVGAVAGYLLWQGTPSCEQSNGESSRLFGKFTPVVKGNRERGSYQISPIQCADGTQVIPWSCPSRATQVDRLKQEKFDVLVIGGGCVGAGVALEGATRGLRVALVERNDFAAGTSGRSTKLIHGGIRYLENAFKKLDYESFELVQEALRERAHLLHAAPFMAKPLPIMIPLYTMWEVPYMWIGAKVYDFVAGNRRSVPHSYYISKDEAMYQFPMLRKEGLRGAIVYYDGMHNDTRMNLLIALTAAQKGAATANYIEVVELLKRKDTDKYGQTVERIVGARVRDTMTGEEWDINARVVVNATGPFADSIRKMDDDTAPSAIVPAAGVHTIIPDHFSPDRMGLIVPKTKDGRVLFFLPWEGSTICGTTDSESEITMTPSPTEDDVNFILEESNRFLSKRVRHSDVKAAWSGLRPLVRDPKELARLRKARQKAESEGTLDEWLREQREKHADTRFLSRKHVIEVSETGLLSVMGGKWTTYRQMAEDAISEIPKHSKLYGTIEVGPSVTSNMQLLGADRAGIVANQNFDRITVTLRERYNFDKDVALYLVSNYGTRALQLAEIACGTRNTSKDYGVDLSARVKRKYPFIWAEVLFAAEQEYSCNALDFLARRTRLAFLDAAAATEAVDKVIEIMGKRLNWSAAEKKRQREEFDNFIKTMH